MRDVSEGRYAWEKLYNAVLSICSSDAPFGERMRDAYIYSLINIRHDRHLPWADLETKFLTLKTLIAPQGEPRQVDGWSEEDRHKACQMLLGLLDNVTSRTAVARNP